MTRLERLPSIISDGLLSDRAVQARSLAGVDIGYRHIKDRRLARPVKAGDGGTVGDYVPFYFAERSPMLYAIKCGNLGSEASDQSKIAYLQTTIERILAGGLLAVYTDLNAALSYARMTADLADLDGDDFVDWPLMRQTMWNNTADDPDRKERRQAECLVDGPIPWALVEGITVRTEAAAEQVVAMLGEAGWRTPVSVRPGWYF